MTKQQDLINTNATTRQQVVIAILVLRRAKGRSAAVAALPLIGEGRMPKVRDSRCSALVSAYEAALKARSLKEHVRYTYVGCLRAVFSRVRHIAAWHE